jgi:hypothetical protein
MERKVLIIGSAPNHIGGVAIHIKRLIEYLSEDFIFDVIDESKNITNDFFNIRSLNFITYFKKILFVCYWFYFYRLYDWKTSHNVYIPYRICCFIFSL